MNIGHRDTPNDRMTAQYILSFINEQNDQKFHDEESNTPFGSLKRLG